MKTILFAILFFTACFSAQAQMRKCVSAEGKVTYSDVVCASTADKDTPVRVRDNTLDASAERQALQAATNAAERNKMLQRPPRECHFQYYGTNDPRGKVLAENAIRECVDNKLSESSGGKKSLDAYRMWKENFDSVTAAKRPVEHRAPPTYIRY